MAVSTFVDWVLGECDERPVLAPLPFFDLELTLLPSAAGAAVVPSGDGESQVGVMDDDGSGLPVVGAGLLVVSIGT